jgi:ssDNA-binding Zn-finger/Zn-ribbon topoisomerase 1
MAQGSCQQCGQAKTVIRNRGRLMCLECSDAEIQRGFTFITIARDGVTEIICRTKDPVTGLAFTAARARSYR